MKKPLSVVVMVIGALMLMVSAFTATASTVGATANDQAGQCTAGLGKWNVPQDIESGDKITVDGVELTVTISGGTVSFTGEDVTAVDFCIKAGSDNQEGPQYFDRLSGTHPRGSVSNIVVYGVTVDGPTDVCPNIEGKQATVPTGMVKNDAGACVTPPPPVDLCPNIDGYQATVPAGMVKDQAGKCALPPPPPPVVVPPVVEPPVVVPPPVITPPVVEPPVVEPPVVEPPVVEPPVLIPPVVIDRPVVDAPVYKTPQPVASTHLAETGSSDSLPIMALSGLGLLLMGVALTRKASRV